MAITLPLLPVELLHHVAQYCSPHDVLALTETCVLFRDCYNDSSVFKKTFLDNVPAVSSPSFESKEALVAYISRQLNAPGAVSEPNRADQQRLMWKCLSVIGLRLQHISDELGRLVSPLIPDIFFTPLVLSERESDPSVIEKSMEQVLGILPASVVWGCSSVCDDEAMRLIDKLFKWIYTSTPEERSESSYPLSCLNSRTLELSFCLAIGALQDRGGSEEAVNDEYFVITPAEAWLGYVDMALHDYIRNHVANADHAPQTPFPQSLSLMICAYVGRACPNPPRPKNIRFLSQGNAQPPLTTSVGGPTGSHVTPDIPLPKVTIESKEDTRPSPSSIIIDSWNIWFQTRTRSIAEELGHGVWQGCYTYGCRPNPATDPLMEQIRFEILPPTGGENMSFTAVDCTDRVGVFRLDGHFNPETGNFTARKSYLGQHAFDWSGAITPLGISGHYHSDRNNYPSGTFWLWKREWKDGR